MSIWNKILIGFIFVVSLVFFYLAARTLRTHEGWRKEARDLERDIKQVEKENRVLEHGNMEAEGDTKGTKQLQMELHHMMIGRGRVWFNCGPQTPRGWHNCDPEPAQANPATGRVDVTINAPAPQGITENTVLNVFDEADAPRKGRFLGEYKVAGVTQGRVKLESSVKMDQDELQDLLQRLAKSRGPWTLYEMAFVVTTDLPDPHGIAEKTVLYVFDEADTSENGSYLGEFRVTGADQKQVFLQPSMRMNKEEHQRLTESRGPWLLCDRMPADNHDTFVDMDQQQLRQLLPEDSVPEYLKDRQAAEPEDPDERLSMGQEYFLPPDPQKNERGLYYFRSLRDYKSLFKYYHAERSVLINEIEAARRDKQYIKSALAGAEVQERFREAEKTRLKQEWDRFDGERKDATTFRDELQGQLKGYRTSFDRIVTSNQTLAGQIDLDQRKAAWRIEERIRRMASSGAGTN